MNVRPMAQERAAALRAWIAELDPDIVCLQEITRGPRADTGAQVDSTVETLRLFHAALFTLYG